MIHFVTFANEKLSATRKRIIKEAVESEFFNEIYELNESALPQELRDYCENNPKGYGFYIWKPYIIDQVLNQISEDDILIYCDAGSSIYKSGRQRFEEYIDMVNKSIYANLSFEGCGFCAEKKYTKGDTFKFLNAENLIEGKQLMAGIIILRNTDFTRKLIQMYKDICLNHRNLIDDSFSTNHPDFFDNRQDQSIFSLLRRKFGTTIIPHPKQDIGDQRLGDWFSEVDEEVIDPYGSKAWKDNKNSKKYPFITSRYRII